MSDLTSQVSADYSQLIREQTRQVDINSFRERGLTKVNVINAKKINELIERAVGSVIARMEHASVQQLKDDKSKVIEDAVAEFKRMTREMSSQKDEAAKAAPAAEQERVRGAVADVLAEGLRELKALHNNAQAKLEHEQLKREQVAAEERKALTAAIESLKAQLADSNASVSGIAKSMDSVAKSVATVSDQAKATADAIASIPAPVVNVPTPTFKVTAPPVNTDAVRDGLLEPLQATLSDAIKQSSEANRAHAEAAASSAAQAAASSALTAASGSFATALREALGDAIAQLGKQIGEGIERASQAAASAGAAAAGSAERSAVEQAKRLDALANAFESSMAGVGSQVAALNAEFATSRQDTATLKSAFTALAGSVASAREDARAMRTEVAEALAKPPGVDATQLQELISGAVGNVQRDLLDRLERQGVVRAGTSSNVGSADEAVASAVVRSAFRDLDAGASEVQMDGVIRKQETAKGDAAQSALDRLRKLRGGK